MSEPLAQAEYAAHIGESFRIDLAGDAAIDMTLAEVNGVGAQTTRHAIEAGRPAPFSVIFSGPKEPILPQSIYTLTHPKLGELELFLVPIGPIDDGGIGYEAAFS